MEGLDSLAQRYGIRPSEFLGFQNGFAALCVDMWAHNWGVQRDAMLVRQSRKRGE
jgi:hypothetical protein